MATLSAIFKLTDKYTPVISKINRKTDEATGKMSKASNSADRLNRKIGSIKNGANVANSGITNLVKGFMTLQAVKGITGLSDELSSMKARLDAINDGSQTTADLQSKIMSAANGARTSYTQMANTVGQVVQRTGDLFKSNDQAILFAENLSKMFAVAGSSQEAAAGATTQLLQALGSGVLRGEELNSVFESAPNIIQKIADYMGVGISKIRQLAEEGKITSEVLKNAMLGSTDEINNKFNAMPTTFGQAMTIIKNNIITVVEPALLKIAQLAQFIVDNWGMIQPILWGVVGALTAYAIALGVAQVATFIATVAAEGFTAALMANPLAWIAVLIGVVVTAISYWVKSVGGIKIAWIMMCNAVSYAWDALKIGIMTGVYALLDLFGTLQIGIGSAYVGIQNATGDLKANVLNTLQSMINGALGYINKFIGALNKIKGVHIEAVQGVTFGTHAMLQNEADKQIRNAQAARDEQSIILQKYQRQASMTKMKADARDNAAKREATLNKAIQASKDAKAAKAANAAKATEFTVPKYSAIAGKVGNKATPVKGTGTGGAVKVEMSNEDLKYLRDVAERDYINKFSTNTLAPNISIQFGDVRETADAKKVSGVIAKILKEEIAMAAEGVY